MKKLLLLAAALLCARAALAAQTVDVALDNKNFIPIRLGNPYCVDITWRGCKASDIMDKLKSHKPAAITKTPAYKGAEQFYGYLTLGARANNKFNFMLDVVSPTDITMYLDADQDGDLTNDPPLKKVGKFDMGGQGYATQIALPWRMLADNAPYTDPFYVWFFVNANMWAQRGFSHSSHTQLMGRVDLGGKPYTAIIADRAETDNNADLEHDGLWLSPGAPVRYKTAEEAKAAARQRDRTRRYISAEQAAAGLEIDGATYKFNIHYPRPQK